MATYGTKKIREIVTRIGFLFVSSLVASLIVITFASCSNKAVSNTIVAPTTMTEPSTLFSSEATADETSGTTPTSNIATEPTTGNVENTAPVQATEPTTATRPNDSSHAHTYTSTIVEPTCTEGGYTRHTCTCGSSYDDNKTPAKGHLYGNWETIKPATTTEEGEKQCVCSRCGYVNSENIPKLNAATGELYQSYIDPRISVLHSGDGRERYSYDHVSCSDNRTWGEPPSISITNEGGFFITYLNKTGEKVTVTIAPMADRVVSCIIRDDGSYIITTTGNPT